MTNQFSTNVPQDFSRTPMKDCSSRTDALPHQYKKLLHEARETNQLLRLLVLMQMREMRQWEGAFGYDPLYDMRPRRKAKKKDSLSMALEGWL